MKRVIRHVVFPAILPASFVVVAALPVEVLGCRTQGWVAVTLSLTGGLAALGATTVGLVGRIRKDPASVWWVASALILALPAFLLVALA